MPALGRVFRLAAVAGWSAFVALTAVLAADPPTAVDHEVQAAIAREGAHVMEIAPAAQGLSTVLAHLGAASVLMPVMVVVGVGWWLQRRTMAPAALLGASYLLMAVVVSAAKGLVGRPEPYDASGAVGRSFPSGHTRRRWWCGAAWRRPRGWCRVGSGVAPACS